MGFGPLALGVLLVARPHATVIVGVQLSAGGIVLAADSSTVDDQGVLLDQKVCKLVAGERHVIGVAGTFLGLIPAVMGYSGELIGVVAYVAATVVMLLGIFIRGL